MGTTDDRNDPGLKEIDEFGMQRNYLVLADGSRKEFVRPVRTEYIHHRCQGITRMGQHIAETYAVDPHFYTGTYCATCRAHYPVGEFGEFTWVDGGEKVGT